MFLPRAPKHQVLPPQAQPGAPTALSSPRAGPELDRAEASRLILAHVSSAMMRTPLMRKEFSSEQGMPTAAVPTTAGDDQAGGPRLVPAAKGWAQLEQLLHACASEFGRNWSSTGSAEVVSALLVTGTAPRDPRAHPGGSGGAPGWPGHTGSCWGAPSPSPGWGDRALLSLP